MVGPFMADAMGGGGASEGFKHLLEHLGPASHVWLEDTNAHHFDWSQQSIDALGSGVNEELKGNMSRSLSRSAATT